MNLIIAFVEYLRSLVWLKKKKTNRRSSYSICCVYNEFLTFFFFFKLCLMLFLIRILLLTLWHSLLQLTFEIWMLISCYVAHDRLRRYLQWGDCLAVRRWKQTVVITWYEESASTTVSLFKHRTLIAYSLKGSWKGEKWELLVISDYMMFCVYLSISLLFDCLPELQLPCLEHIFFLSLGVGDNFSVCCYYYYPWLNL